MTLKGKTGAWGHVTPLLIGHLHEIQQLGVDYLAVKIADGAHAYYPAAREQVTQDAATIGLQIVAWAYVYPNDINAAVHAICDNLPPGCTDLILDAEVEWEGKNPSLADALCHGIADATGHKVNLYLSSFCNPSEHPLPYAAFLSHCEGFCPQVYQEGSTPIDAPLGRLHTESVEMAKKSLGGLLIPTVNVPALVHPASIYDGLNVWLVDGVQLASGRMRPAGQDQGIFGYEADWKAVLSV